MNRSKHEPIEKYKGDPKSLLRAPEAARLLDLDPNGFSALVAQGAYVGTVYEAKSPEWTKDRHCHACGQKTGERHYGGTVTLYYDPKQVVAMEVPREWRAAAGDLRDPFKNQRRFPLDNTTVV